MRILLIEASFRRRRRSLRVDYNARGLVDQCGYRGCFGRSIDYIA